MFPCTKTEDKGIDEYQHSRGFHLNAAHVQVKSSIVKFVTYSSSLELFSSSVHRKGKSKNKTTGKGYCNHDVLS